VIMSKNIVLNHLIDLVICPNNMLFVVYSSNTVYLFNMLNLNYTIWSDFSGDVTSVIFNENGKYILVSTSHVECPVYVIYHASMNFFNKNSYNSNEFDIEQAYLHQEYHFYHKIFNLSFSKDYCIQKIQGNLEQNRLLVLYEKHKSDELSTQVMLFQVDFNADINNFSVEFLLPINNVKQLMPSNFEIAFNHQRDNEAFLILWGDSKIGNFYIYPANSK